jgi:uncharacterized LabA/DUF88 family protein
MERVISYIDGFNLYHGVRAMKLSKYKWLDVQALSKSLIVDKQILVHTKYFTARISDPPDKVERQSTYLDALGSLDDLTIIEGQYEKRDITCPICYACYPNSKEKRTDVNIAVQMVFDGLADLYDVALLISGDSDLVPAVLGIQANMPGKRVVVACPPNRYSNELKQVANVTFGIYERRIKKSMLPDVIRGAKNYPLRRPATWR